MRMLLGAAVVMFLALSLLSTSSGEAADWTSFSAPFGNPSTGAAWGDYDADGFPDLYVSSSWGANHLYHNNGDGSFTDVTTPPLSDASDGRGVAWGDYDNDGDLDLYLSNNTGSNKLFRNDDGSFIDVTVGALAGRGRGWDVSWGDYDEDGWLDLLLVYNPGSIEILHNNTGNGTFTSVFVTGYCSYSSVSWVDYDNDADLDFYALCYGSAGKLYRNNGDGTFGDVSAAALNVTGLGQAWGDYDNDGDLDLYISRWGYPNRLVRNDGDGYFTEVTQAPLADAGYGRGVSWADYDNDGDLDLYLANGDAENADHLFRNDGGNAFTDVTASPLGSLAAANSAVWADYDNDGDVDLFLADGTAGGVLYRNDLAPGNHWLQIDLLGDYSNRSGIGARVSVAAGGTTQIREISGGSGYLGQCSLTAEFGLGAATEVDVSVLWPSGIVQEVTGIVADTRVLIAENGPAPPPGLLSVGSGKGISGIGTVRVPVSLTSNVAAPALEFRCSDVPDGIEVVAVHPVGRAAAMTASFVDGGNAHILVYSPAGGMIASGSGQILDLEVSVLPGAVLGDTLALALSGVVMSDPLGHAVTLATEDGYFAVTRLDGDINADNLVDVGDLVRLVEIILGAGDPPTADELVEADCNDDASFDALDVTCLLDLILGDPEAPSPGIEPLTVAAGELLVRADAEVRGIQFTIPAGTPIPQALPGLAPLQLSVGRLSDGRRVALAFTSSGKGWAPGLRTPLLMDGTPGELRAYGPGGRPLQIAWEGAEVRIGPTVSAGLRALAAQPNPFRAGTVIGFSTDTPGRIAVTVYDVRGARVSRLPERMVTAGEHRWPWTAVSDRGTPLPAGMYIAVIEGNGRQATSRLIHLGQ